MSFFKTALELVKQRYQQILATLLFFGVGFLLLQYATQMITDVGMPREVKATEDAGEVLFDEEGIALPLEEELFHE